MGRRSCSRRPCRGSCQGRTPGRPRPLSGCLRTGCRTRPAWLSSRLPPRLEKLATWLNRLSPKDVNVLRNNFPLRSAASIPIHRGTDAGSIQPAMNLQAKERQVKSSIYTSKGFNRSCIHVRKTSRYGLSKPLCGVDSLRGTLQ